MLGSNLLLAVIGLSSGLLVAGGLFGFIVSLGVVSVFADRTHTGKHTLLYEDMVAFGGICGNLLYVLQPKICSSEIAVGLFGLCAGIFVGCWSMALAEVLNVFPILFRRAKIPEAAAYIIICTAIGKGIGAFIYAFL